jgi:elongation factor G
MRESYPTAHPPTRRPSRRRCEWFYGGGQQSTLEVPVSGHRTELIRNVVLVGHGGAGKTTLADALLARAGAVSRPGRVDDGTSVLCSEPEEVKRRCSLSLALAPFRWTATDGRTYTVNLIDTPGYPDFVGEVDAALSVADLAVFVVSAVEGPEVQTELLWRRVAAMGMPRMVFVNKVDKDRADFARVLQQLRASFGHGFAVLELPLGEAAGLHGLVDLLSEEALEYEPSGGHHNAPVPGDALDVERPAHETLLDEIVAGDDEQLEHYLAGEVPSVADLERVLAGEVLRCEAFPVMLGSAATGVGVDRFADFVCELGPSPADRAVHVEAGGDLVRVEADPAGRPLAYVFKTISDPFVGQLSLFKVLSGRIATDEHLVNTRSGTDERMHSMFELRGREQTHLDALCAGDIGVVAKLTTSRAGDTLAPKGLPVRMPGRDHASPQHAVAIVPRTQADDDKLASCLERLLAEDPVLRVDRDPETRQTVLRGVGDTHVTVAIERLARKFGINVDVADVQVAYRETITKRGEAIGKVKKQSGGHGQFAIVDLRVEPLGRGEGHQFRNTTVGGVIPRQYIPAIEKGVNEVLVAGGVFGFPVVDVSVECYDGRYHAVDSSEMAFSTAAAQGFKDALAAAGPVVLEPVSRLRVTVPVAYEGDVMGDIGARRGRVQGTDAAEHGEHEIVALVPTSELMRYAVDLRSITSGRGRFSAHHDRYEVLPPHLVERG